MFIRTNSSFFAVLDKAWVVGWYLARVMCQENFTPNSMDRTFHPVVLSMLRVVFKSDFWQVSRNGKIVSRDLGTAMCPSFLTLSSLLTWLTFPRDRPFHPSPPRSCFLSFIDTSFRTIGKISGYVPQVTAIQVPFSRDLKQLLKSTRIS